MFMKKGNKYEPVVKFTSVLRLIFMWLIH